MPKVLAAITTSVDGYIVAGLDDGPGQEMGEGGERLHYWARWPLGATPTGPKGEATGEDAEWLAETTSRIGAVVGGRWTYEAARHWGDENPWGLPFFIVTHRPEEQPAGDDFTFVSGVEAAVERAREAAGGKDVSVMGGADVIRQALAAGLVDERPRYRRAGRPRRRQAAVRGASRSRWTSSSSACGNRGFAQCSSRIACRRPDSLSLRAMNHAARSPGPRRRSRPCATSRRRGLR